jgi:hypothetical protein
MIRAGAALGAGVLRYRHRFAAKVCHADLAVPRGARAKGRGKRQAGTIAAEARGPLLHGA